MDDEERKAAIAYGYNLALTEALRHKKPMWSDNGGGHVYAVSEVDLILQRQALGGIE